MIRRSRRPSVPGLGMSRITMVLIAIGIIGFAIGAGALLGYYTTGFKFRGGIRDVFVPSFGGKQTVRILVLGEDNSTARQKVKTRGLSDTIILMSVDLTTKHVAAISVPRDTRVDLDGYGGVRKINSSYSIGGPTLTALAVEQLLHVKPDYYIQTNIEGFKDSVDTLGGVEIDVEKNMNYDDNWGNLHIHLKKGRQLLNGEQAMGYVRFRHDAMGDISRIQRQQKFVKAFVDKALTTGNLPKLPGIMRDLSKNVETDMTIKDLLYLARFAGKVDMSKVKMEMVPGVPEYIGGISYWIADEEETSKVVQELFYPPQPTLPTVEVLNGNGTPGVAQQVADALRQQGYEVAAVGNADSYDYALSQVISHSKDVEDINRIASAVNSTIIKYEEDPNAKADVTVIVGKDYAFDASGT